MFDDQQPPVGGQVPGNLPIGEPEDMFSAVDHVEEQPQTPLPPPPVTPAVPEVAPVEEAQPTALSAGILKPKQSQAEELPPVEPEAPVALPPLAEPPAMPTENDPINQLPPLQAQSPHTMADIQPPGGGEYKVTEPTLTRGLMAMVVVGVVVAILGFGGWFVYASFIRPSADTTPTPPVSSNTFNIDDSAVPVAEQPSVTPPVSTNQPSALPPRGGNGGDDAILFGAPIDFDDDGLDDEQEAVLGTDPQNWDTDEDGLSDGVEVVVWETDPLNPDTDGDSYLDGTEVRAGYSPKGEGRLPLINTVVPTETGNTSTTSTSATSTIE